MKKQEKYRRCIILLLEGLEGSCPGKGGKEMRNGRIIWLVLIFVFIGIGVFLWFRNATDTGGEGLPNGTEVTEGVGLNDGNGGDSAAGKNGDTDSAGGQGEQIVSKPAEPELPGALLVMCDNMRNARPQSGLDKADVVYEIIAESGITRFMALFYRQKVDEIGPIRSARSYFVKLAHGYNAPLAHAGGSAEALNLIATIKAKDLDEIYNSGGYFWRDKSRKMPHNLYSSTDKLLAGAKNRGYKMVPPELSPVGTAWDGEAFTDAVTLDYSTGSYTYKVTWEYEQSKNCYARMINGKPHLMKDGAAIEADNVIILVIKTTTRVEGGVPLSDVQIVGSGEACYFLNGQKMTGSWEKQAASAPIRFFDEKGNFMKLKEGNTWIQVIPSWRSLT